MTLDSLEELSDEFAEGNYDEAIPVLAGLAARSVLSAAAGRAVRRVSRPLRRRVLRSAVQTAQSLVRQGGAEGMRALPRIVRRVARRAARTGLRPTRCPKQFSVPPRKFWHNAHLVRWDRKQDPRPRLGGAGATSLKVFRAA